MQVKIYSLNNGLEIFDDIKIIRIVSEDYNLLILKDYMPIIGEIKGTFEIESETIHKKLKLSNAYYINHENVFELLIKED